jgi:hypothetical protein
MKSTDNKKPPIRINSVIFAIFWALSYVIGAAAAYFLTFTLFEPPLQTVPWWYTFGMIFTLLTTMGVVSSSIQRAALWLRFGRRLKWWQRTSIIGWWLGGLVIFGLSRLAASMNNPDLLFYWHPIALFLELSIPLTVMQWLVLRRYVDRAWLYILASLASAITFAGLLMANNGSINFMGFFLSLGASSLGIAYTLVWLFSMSSNIPSKQKNMPDTSRLMTADAAEQSTNALPYAETPSELSKKSD